MTYSDYNLPDFRNISFGIQPRAFPEQMCVVFETNQKEGQFPVLFYMSTDRNVSYKNYEICFSWYWLYGPYEPIKDYKIYIELERLPFESGDEIFVMGYVCNKEEYGDWSSNLYTGYEELSTLEPDKHTPLMSFIIP